MNNIISLNDRLSNGNHLLTLIEVKGGQYFVQFGDQLHIAELAFSCIVTPEQGDKVLCSVVEGYPPIIIAIVERIQTDQTSLHIPGKANISSQSGQISINAAKELDLVSSSINQVSQSWCVGSADSVFQLGRSIVSGDSLKSNFKKLISFSDSVHTVAKQCLQKFYQYTRKTDQMDQIKAGQMSRKAEGLYMLHSKHSMLLSKKEMKLDAEHIHMG